MLRFQATCVSNGRSFCKSSLHNKFRFAHATSCVHRESLYYPVSSHVNQCVSEIENRLGGKPDLLIGFLNPKAGAHEIAPLLPRSWLTGFVGGLSRHILTGHQRGVPVVSLFGARLPGVHVSTISAEYVGLPSVKSDVIARSFEEDATTHFLLFGTSGFNLAGCVEKLNSLFPRGTKAGACTAFLPNHLFYKETTIPWGMAGFALQGDIDVDVIAGLGTNPVPTEATVEFGSQNVTASTCLYRASGCRHSKVTWLAVATGSEGHMLSASEVLWRLTEFAPEDTCGDIFAIVYKPKASKDSSRQPEYDFPQIRVVVGQEGKQVKFNDIGGPIPEGSLIQFQYASPALCRERMLASVQALGSAMSASERPPVHEEVGAMFFSSSYLTGMTRPRHLDSLDEHVSPPPSNDYVLDRSRSLDAGAPLELVLEEIKAEAAVMEFEEYFSETEDELEQDMGRPHFFSVVPSDDLIFADDFTESDVEDAVVDDLCLVDSAALFTPDDAEPAHFWSEELELDTEERLREADVIFTPFLFHQPPPPPQLPQLKRDSSSSTAPLSPPSPPSSPSSAPAPTSTTAPVSSPVPVSVPAPASAAAAASPSSSPTTLSSSSPAAASARAPSCSASVAVTGVGGPEGEGVGGSSSVLSSSIEGGAYIPKGNATAADLQAVIDTFIASRGTGVSLREPIEDPAVAEINAFETVLENRVFDDEAEETTTDVDEPHSRVHEGTTLSFNTSNVAAIGSLSFAEVIATSTDSEPASAALTPRPNAVGHVANASSVLILLRRRSAGPQTLRERSSTDLPLSGSNGARGSDPVVSAEIPWHGGGPFASGSPGQKNPHASEHRGCEGLRWAGGEGDSLTEKERTSVVCQDAAVDGPVDVPPSEGLRASATACLVSESELSCVLGDVRASVAYGGPVRTVLPPLEPTPNRLLSAASDVVILPPCPSVP
eukprot:Rmarinus@m.18237